mmetsp:Transcript_46066/g.128022  ORF Transcript_46066/g.128022 Transcript_46066/m.128022 type:complete len:328 (-) Transcript_46066:92-1075(-)
MGALKEFAIRILIVVSCPWAIKVGLDGHKEIIARQTEHPDDYPQYGDLKMALVVFGVLLLVQLLFRRIFKPVAKSMVVKKQRWSHGVWGAKVTRCCDAVFKCCFYVAMTTWCWFLLRDQPWTPWVLGGSGQTRFCWTDGHPYQRVPADVKRFYMVAFGFHLSEAAMLFLETRAPDFWEMLLHHLVTCCMIFFSYMLNYVRVGSLILFLHGATDVFIYASKVFVDTPFLRCTGFFYFGLVLAYAWLRIYVFPAYVMKSSWVESVTEARGGNLYGWGFLNFGLIALLTLHMYWFGLIIKIGMVFRRSGQARDLQANLSELDVRAGKKKA